MAGDPGQDWWSLVFLFATGLVSVAVEMIRRKAENIDDEDDRRRRTRTHHRCDDDCEHYHRRHEDHDQENEES